MTIGILEHKPNISFRRCISWANSVRSEPTSTLVLTSAARRFVDLRIFVDAPPPQSGSQTYNPNLYHPLLGRTSEDLAYLEHQLKEATVSSTSLERLEWGFAGTSSSTPARWSEADDESRRYVPAHSKWHRTLDSKAASSGQAANLVDEGDMWPDRDWPRLELERGHMPHPQTGEITPYDEIWQEIEVRALLDREASGDDRCCIVLVTVKDEMDKDSHAQGIIIRVGQFVQGIVKLGDKLRVQRWQWTRDLEDDRQTSQSHTKTSRKTKHGVWACTVDLGPKDDTLDLPCHRTWDEASSQISSNQSTKVQDLKEPTARSRPSWYCVEATKFTGAVESSQTL